ncbi:unnamed protein product [Paramecium pentaurelia]|uniref:Uncharacterized protein n=1 Tax=Paramecium pentaurelia TaxID=43138 RepID=A0A8S1UJ33_9CILI|nr:unnamed protein product [Paramecium pentaurelia]
MQPYYFTADKQIDFQLDPEMQINLIQLKQQDILPCSNYNQLAYFTQFSYPLPISAYPIDGIHEQKITDEQKPKKTKIQNTDSKGRLLKSRESENNLLIILLKNNFRMNNSVPQQIYHYSQGTPLPQLQSDIISNYDALGSQEGSRQTQKSKGLYQQVKQPKKKEHMKTGHLSLQEHTTQTIFLQQFEGIMTSSMMKKLQKYSNN